MFYKESYLLRILAFDDPGTPGRKCQLLKTSRSSQGNPSGGCVLSRDIDALKTKVSCKQEVFFSNEAKTMI